jgi:hypothetical protein
MLLIIYRTLFVKRDVLVENLSHVFGSVEYVECKLTKENLYFGSCVRKQTHKLHKLKCILVEVFTARGQ